MGVHETRVAVLALAFSPVTDPVWKSLSSLVTELLKQRGAAIVAYKPIAAGNMRVHLPDSQVCRHFATAVEVAFAVLMVTSWEEITPLDEESDTMATPVAVDDYRTISRRDTIVYEGFI